MHAMNPPMIGQWVFEGRSIFENKVWTEECQGLISDGNYWYGVSNNEQDPNINYDEFGEPKEVLNYAHKGIYKFTLDFQPLGFLQYPKTNHVGAPCYQQGKIYVPVEEGSAAKVWVLDTNLETKDIRLLGGSNPNSLRPQGGSMSWCAINPWDGYLYSSTSDNVNQVFTYDPNNDFEFMNDENNEFMKPPLQLGGGTINKVQGGCISENGHLYLTSEWPGDLQFDPFDPTTWLSGEIRAYSLLNGTFLGSHRVRYDTGVFVAEEMEGIAIAHIVRPGGISTYLHVIILDNDLSPDDVSIRHYIVPDPKVL
jgi:hypothetical protein